MAEFDADTDPSGFVGLTVPEATKKWQLIVGVTADGVFGPLTETATKKWQSAHGINPDGVVGPETWSTVLGVPDANYPPTLKRTGSTAQASTVSSGHQPAAQAAPQAPKPPLAPGAFLSKAGWPLWTGLLLVGGAVFSKVQRGGWTR
jgi:hypothetical protein